MANIPFTNNYTDLSSQRGFQFKFFCGKCASGYMSTFRPNRLGGAAAAANVAASLLGGIFSRAAQKARAVDYVGKRDLAQVAAVLCPSCGAKTHG